MQLLCFTYFKASSDELAVHLLLREMTARFEIPTFKLAVLLTPSTPDTTALTS